MFVLAHCLTGAERSFKSLMASTTPPASETGWYKQKTSESLRFRGVFRNTVSNACSTLMKSWEKTPAAGWEGQYHDIMKHST